MRTVVQSSSSRGTGHTEQQYELTKPRNSASSKLLLATNKGEAFKSAQISIYKPGTTIVGAKISLGHAMISSFKLDLGLAKPTETLTLAAAPKQGV